MEANDLHGYFKHWKMMYWYSYCRKFLSQLELMPVKKFTSTCKEKTMWYKKKLFCGGIHAQMMWTSFTMSGGPAIFYWGNFVISKLIEVLKCVRCCWPCMHLWQVPKLLLHRIFPNVRYSIWIDGKLQLVVDPYQILERYIPSSICVSLSCPWYVQAWNMGGLI